MTLEQTMIRDRELKKLDERFDEFMKIANSSRVAQQIFRQPMFTDPLRNGARFWIHLFTSPDIDTFFYVVAEEKSREKCRVKAVPTDKLIRALDAYYEEVKIKQWGAVARAAAKFGVSSTALRRLLKGSYKRRLELSPEDETAVKAIALPVVFSIAANAAGKAQ